MTDTKYDVHPEVVKLVDFKLLILALPTEDLDDLLAHFITERGKISKSFYEDFLIANCVGNLNQFMAHIQDRPANKEFNLIEIRAEVIALILKYNSLLSPENIYINKNQVVKIRPKKGKINGISLIENIYWHKSYYDDKGQYKPEHDDSVCAHCRPPEVNDKEEGQRSIDTLDWANTQVWWARINEYITIKKFSLTDIEYILKQRYFHNRTSFNTYIVSNCVLNVEDIYDRIEGMGVNVDPNKIIRELFTLCEGVNEGMNYEHAKELQRDVDSNDDDEEFADDSLPSPPKRAQAGTGFTKKSKKNKKAFKDVPKQELLMLSHNMKASLIGQNEAIDTLTEAIKRASVGLKDPYKPIGSFLFTGKTGIGKTTASKVLADELIKDKNNLVMIDCSEFTSDHEYAKLIGSPNGYIGFENGGRLTNAINDNPFSVVVFDEIEKASHKVHELLLQVLDDGRLTDGKGKTVSFKDAIIIMTSNIGVKEVDDVAKTIGFGDVAVLTEDKKKKALDAALKRKFKPEFLNRIDSIVHFKDLTKQDYLKIIELELYKLNDNLKVNDTEYKHIQLNFDAKIKQFIYKQGVDEKFGARPIKRAIEKYIATELADLLLNVPTENIAQIEVTVKNNKVMLWITEYADEEEVVVEQGMGA